MEREQLYQSPRQEKRIWFIRIAVMLLVAVLAGILIYTYQNRYVPPKHDTSAKTGMPQVEASYLYGDVYTAFGYHFSLASNLYQNANKEVCIYLTNPAENNIYLLCEMKDIKTGKTLYKTDYIKPGEYIERIKNESVKNTHYDVELIVYAFNMTDFTSEGTTNLQLELQPW